MGANWTDNSRTVLLTMMVDHYIISLDVSVASICKLLKESNFSRKKMQLVALQRDSMIRERFVQATSLFNLDMMVFIDESGCDRRDAIRKYGYGLRGMPVKSQKLLLRGQRISVTVECILDLKKNFHATVLLPHL